MCASIIYDNVYYAYMFHVKRIEFIHVNPHAYIRVYAPV